MAVSGRLVASGNVTYNAATGVAPTAVSIGETVDPAKCFIEFTSSTSNPNTTPAIGRHAFTAEFAGDPINTIQFRRGIATSAQDVIISWAVVELTGVTVEHVEVNPTTTPVHTNISANADNSIALIALRGSNATTINPLRGSAYLTKDGTQSRLTYVDNAAAPTTGRAITRAQIIEFATAQPLSL